MFYSVFHQTFDKQFPKFVLNSRSLLQTWKFHYVRSCQSNHELRNEVVNFMPNFIGKLRSSLQVKFASFGVVGLIM